MQAVHFGNLTMLNRLRETNWSRHLFADVASAWRFAGARSSRLKADPVVLRLRGGATVYCRPGSSDASVLWDTFERAYHAPALPLPPRPVIVDLGCNVGYTLLHLGALYPQARLVGVELDATNFSIAQTNTAQLGDRCELVLGAVWTRDGEIAYGGEEEWGFSVVADAVDRKARALTISTLFRECGLTRVDYLKMDIEGAEAAIFGDDLSWLHGVAMLQVEVHPPCTVDDIADRLVACGFACEVAMRAHPAIFAARRS
jgi:FkbM family methyltransferase